MSERNGDPLQDLHRLWQELEAPAPDGPGDAATQASVAWAQAAWKTMAPLPQVPQLRKLPSRRLRPVLLMPIAVAAAAWLIWLGLGERVTAPAVPMARLAAGDHPAHQTPTPSATTAPFRAYPRADGSLELRRGRVRLILIDNPTTKDQ